MKPLLNRTIFLQLFAIVSMLMIIPSVVAFVENDYFVARTFLYSCFAGIIVYALIAIASVSMMDKRSLERRPDFKEYMDTTPAIFINVFKKG